MPTSKVMALGIKEAFGRVRRTPQERSYVLISMHDVDVNGRPYTREDTAFNESDLQTLYRALRRVSMTEDEWREEQDQQARLAVEGFSPFFHHRGSIRLQIRTHVHCCLVSKTLLKDLKVPTYENEIVCPCSSNKDTHTQSG